MKIAPLPDWISEISAAYERVVFFEESLLSGGVAERLGSQLMKRGFRGQYETVGVDKFVPAATVDEQMKMFALDKESMIEKLMQSDKEK